jgi:hypothetical protein
MEQRTLRRVARRHVDPHPRPSMSCSPARSARGRAVVRRWAAESRDAPTAWPTRSGHGCPSSAWRRPNRTGTGSVQRQPVRRRIADDGLRPAAENGREPAVRGAPRTRQP